MKRTILRAGVVLVGGALALPLLAQPPGAGERPNATPNETPAEIARREYDEVLRLTPNAARGRQVYLTCAVCHLPEGWGSVDGSYPQIAGQWRTVIIKQLADFRAGNRDNPLMYPFSVPEVLGGPQEIADVAAYVAQLPMTAHNGLGPGTDLDKGKALYTRHCADCHGAAGEGDEADSIPVIAGQHYAYLMRQFDAIRAGERKNADSKMSQDIQNLTTAERSAILDYSARLRPAPEKRAPEGWSNPDFPDYLRDELERRARPPLKPAPASDRL